MTEDQAYKYGVLYAEEADRYGDFTEEELADEDAFASAMYEILDNQPQFGGHISYEITREPNADELFDAFYRGQDDGVSAAVERRFHNHAEA